MIHFKTDEEIEIQRESSLPVGKTLAEVARVIRPGVKTIELDKVAETFIHDHGAVPVFKVTEDFREACASRSTKKLFMEFRETGN